MKSNTAFSTPRKKCAFLCFALHRADSHVIAYVDLTAPIRRTDYDLVEYGNCKDFIRYFSTHTEEPC